MSQHRTQHHSHTRSAANSRVLPAIRVDTEARDRKEEPAKQETRHVGFKVIDAWDMDGDKDGNRYLLMTFKCIGCGAYTYVSIPQLMRTNHKLSLIGRTWQTNYKFDLVDDITCKGGAHHPIDGIEKTGCGGVFRD